MDAFSYVDIFATKGIEYIVVIGFLLALLGFWRIVTGSGKGVGPSRRFPLTPAATQWFSLADGFYYHQGHSWAKPEGSSMVKIGMDDFSQKLLGKPRLVKLPRVGERLVQGEKGWQFEIDSKTVDMLAPLSGEVAAVNDEVLKRPGIIDGDPYGRGWLLLVRPSRLRGELKNLLSGYLASAWMEESTESLRAYFPEPAGAVLQDGGVPVAGIAKSLFPGDWEEIARDLLLTG